MLLSFCYGCGAGDKQDEELRTLDKECRTALQSWQWDKLDSLSAKLLTTARAVGDPGYEARALYYDAAYRPQDSPKRMEERQARLLQAENLAEQTENDSLLVSINITRGTYELARFQRYHTAQYYFNKAAEQARRLGSMRLEIAATINLSEVSRLLEDTMGLNTDLRLHRLARLGDDQNAIFAAAFHLALYYTRSRADSAKLYTYLNEMRRTPDLTWVADAVEAQYYLNTGDLPRAYTLAERADPRGQLLTAGIMARILAKMGRPAESNEYIDIYLSAPKSASDYLTRGSLMELRADNLQALGDTHDAYLAARQASQWKDSVYSELKLDQINRFRVEYEVGEKNHRIEMQDASIRRITSLSVCGIVFLCLVIMGILFYTHRRRAFYRTIVRQRLEALEKKPVPEEKNSMKSAKIDDETGSTARLQELYERIRREVEERQAYRDVTITREGLAERLGTNRTYLTEAIKSATGMSYTKYMNTHRINEAIRILSDPADDTPLKQLASQLGFLSLNTFYTAFRQTTGVSPAAFRTTARELKKSQSTPTPDA